MLSSFYGSGLDAMLNDPVVRQSLLQMVEGRQDIDGRFIDIQRLSATGGNGYFSLLFSATDNTTGQRVALKVLHPGCTDPYRIASFEREEDILRSLAGQRDIITWVAPRSQFVEMFNHQALPISLPVPMQYYAVELARESVGAVLAADRWTPEHRLLAFRAMCRALQRIHKQSIAHRDLKPDNFLVLPDRTIKLADFGTARRLDATGQALQARYHAPPGDMRYTAPEMIAGLHTEDPQLAYGADIFALGAILFELCAGTQLTLQIYDRRFEQDLMHVMTVMQSGRRIDIYNQFVSSIVAARPLPSVAAFGTPVPPCIRTHVNTLYRSMAALDYRSRIRSFQRIFRQIDICLVILRNEQKYQRWQAAKLQRRRAVAIVGRGGN